MRDWRMVVGILGFDYVNDGWIIGYFWSSLIRWQRKVLLYSKAKKVVVGWISFGTPV